MREPEIQRFKLKHVDATHELALRLSSFFPCPDESLVGIHELLLNAIEHGNLNIGFEKKTDLIRQGQWRQEINRRSRLPEYRNREVEVMAARAVDECRLTITDQGKGFAWHSYIERPLNSILPNGRGLWIAYNSKFSGIIFNQRGNIVTCIASYRT